MGSSVDSPQPASPASSPVGAPHDPWGRLEQRGPGPLTDSELLALLWRPRATHRGVRELADQLLGAAGGLRALCQLDPQELAACGRLGKHRSAQLLAALELGRRAQLATEQRPRLCTPEQIYRHLRGELALLRREQFWVLSFNARNVLLRATCVAHGTVNECPVDPREVFAGPLACRASAIVLAHNHPAGDPEPSALDVALTRQLARAAELLGIRLLDHLVIGEAGFVSLASRGLVPGESTVRFRAHQPRNTRTGGMR